MTREATQPPPSGRDDDVRIRFDDYVFLPRAGLLLRGDSPVAVPPRAVRILECLARRQGEIVSRDDLIREVWEGAAVTEHSVSEAVNVLRQALGDDPQDPSYIQTVHRRGYRFIAPVSVRPAERSTATPDPAAAGRQSGRALPGRPWRTAAAVAAVLVSLALGVAVGSGLLAGPGVGSSDPVARLSLNLPADAPLRSSFFNPAFDVSRDGRRIAYLAQLSRTPDGEIPQMLYLRDLESRDTRPLLGTQDASAPSFGPDGSSVAFFTSGELVVVSPAGFSRRALADAPRGRGADWLGPDRIVYCPSPGSGLWLVGVDGGEPERLTSPDPERSESGHYWPDVLPGGRHALFTVWTGRGFDRASVAVVDLRSGEYRTLLSGGAYARYLPPDRLVFAQRGRLLVVPFDAGSLEVRGTPVPALDGVLTTPTNGSAQYALSGTGMLIYVEGDSPYPDTDVVEVGMDGSARSVTERPRKYYELSLSPGGGHLALSILRDDSFNIWVHDLERGSFSRLSFGERELRPVWSPDSSHIAFAASGGGRFQILARPVDAGHEPDLVWSSQHWVLPESWSPDGRLLAFTEYAPDTAGDIWLLEMPGEDGPEPASRGNDDASAAAGGVHPPSAASQPQLRRSAFLRTEFHESGARFSPDGRWLAYHSKETGQFEVYVRDLEGGSKYQVSTSGGASPEWSRRGDRLFYRNGEKVLAASVDVGTVESRDAARFRAGTPRLLFEGPYADGPWTYAVQPDGEGFLMIRVQHIPPTTELLVVQGWPRELDRLIAAR